MYLQCCRWTSRKFGVLVIVFAIKSMTAFDSWIFWFEIRKFERENQSNAIEQTGLRIAVKWYCTKWKVWNVSFQSKETHAAMILQLIWASFTGRIEQLERNVVQMRDIERKEKTTQFECVVHCSCKVKISWESTQGKMQNFVDLKQGNAKSFWDQIDWNVKINVLECVVPCYCN